MKTRDALLAECRAVIDRQCKAHSVERTNMLDGVLNNLLSYILAEWEEALEELQKLRDDPLNRYAATRPTLKTLDRAIARECRAQGLEDAAEMLASRLPEGANLSVLAAVIRARAAQTRLGSATNLDDLSRVF